MKFRISALPASLVDVIIAFTGIDANDSWRLHQAGVEFATDYIRRRTGAPVPARRDCLSACKWCQSVLGGSLCNSCTAGVVPDQNIHGRDFIWKIGNVRYPVRDRNNGPAYVSPSRQEWYKRGLLHREGAPAIMTLRGGQYWYRNGKKHRRQVIGTMIEDGQQVARYAPAVITYSDATAAASSRVAADAAMGAVAAGTAISAAATVKYEWWFDGKPVNEDGSTTHAGYREWCNAMGSLHRDDGPAIVSETCKKWFIYGHIHREGGPAVINYSNGIVESEHWYQYNRLHRVGAPAVIEYKNGAIYSEKWLVEGEYSRNDGPAVIIQDGHREWCVNNRKHRGDDLPAVIAADGTQTWYRHGYIHRDDDKPAMIAADGTQTWYYDGRIHRNGDKPAVIAADGKQMWYRNGVMHRADGKPHAVSADGTQMWYRNNHIHRDGDLPAMIAPDGTQTWYYSGVIHRADDKPAVIAADGTQTWYCHGEIHRGGDKPAVIAADGTQTWYCRGNIHRDGDKPAVIAADSTRTWYQFASVYREYGPFRLGDGGMSWCRHHGKTAPGSDNYCGSRARCIELLVRLPRLLKEMQRQQSAAAKKLVRVAGSLDIRHDNTQ